MTRAALLILAVLLAAPPAFAASDGALIAARPIRAGATVLPEDVARGDAFVRGALFSPEEAVGQESRLFLPTGRVIFPSDLAPPALVERNQIVRLHFQKGPLLIQLDARALDRAGMGERVRVMNLDSRTTVVATVVAPGQVEVK